MSSGESPQDGAGALSDNKRRRPNACDMCRKRKIRCDGKQARTGKCSNCTTREWECEFGAFTAAKGKYSGYIEALEVKIKRLESLIKRLLPDRDFTAEVGYELTRDNWMMPGVCGTSVLDDSVAYSSSSPGVMGTPAAATASSFSIIGPDQAPPMTHIPEDGHSSDEEDSITTKLQHLPVITSATPLNMTHYLGKSSAAGLLKTAVALCGQLAPHVDASSIFSTARKRPEWMHDLGIANVQAKLNFPDPDLLDELVRLYFLHVHTFSPILHHPTFEADRRSGLHLRDRTFGGLVLLVCAVAARFSHDSRVLVDVEQNDRLIGWQWYSQVQLYDPAHITKPTSHLLGLQTICLGVLYSTSVSHLYAWVHAGLGIRLALDLGAHKRRAYGVTPSVEDELYKRSFWMLLYLDRTLSSSMGRPCSMQEEDFDLELPLCCDDEYLSHEDPRQVAKQPEDRPSYTSYFIWLLKLSQIHGLALRTLYASTKARAHYNFQGEDWVTRTTAHLDSLLNNWANTVPDHLRWDPDRVDDLFFCQSAHLYMWFHELQIMVHRQFLAAYQPAAPMSSSALTICMSAARMVTRLINALLEKSPERIALVRWDAAYSSLVLLVGLGIARLNGLTGFDSKQTLSDVDAMIDTLRIQEDHWRCAGRFAHAIGLFKALGEDSNFEPTQQRKRRHEEDSFLPRTQSAPFGQSQPSFSQTQDALLRAELDAPSVFTSGPVNGTIGGENHLMSTSISQEAGAVFGNIDFGALFGFGNESLQNTRTQTHIPTDLGGDTDMFAGLRSDDRDAHISDSDDWMTMPFDFGLGDWQWLTPGGAGETSYTNSHTYANT